MGRKGWITRILSPFTYAPLREEDKTAPGQLLWKQLDLIYRYRSINPQTRLYGLIGSPIDHSIGHLYHNDQFRKYHQDAVYLKLEVAAEELPLFWQEVQTLPFFGFSITAPLKERLVPSETINTLYRTEKEWHYCSTDGVAALEVLGEVLGKRVVILGTGGVAKAIAFVLKKEGADLKLLQRNETIPYYDILINATSSPKPDFVYRWIPHSIVMDVATYCTPFLKQAQMGKARTVNGLSLYFHQALLQSVLWRHLT